MLIRWNPRAQSDFDREIDYIAAENLFAAFRVRDIVLHHTQLLAKMPEMGRTGRKHGTRELVIAGTRYIAVYRVRVTAVEVIRFLNTAQDYSG